MSRLNPASEARRLEIRGRIQEYLARHIVDSGKIADGYILHQDIKDAWSHDFIVDALYPANLSNTDIELIRVKVLRFLSILVYIDAHDFLNNFRKHFFGVNGQLVYEDCNLPLKDDAVPPLGSFMLRKRFLDDQYLFIPEILLESSSVTQIDDQRRLPFESVSRNLFAGAYGTVDKVKISPFCFKSRDLQVNEQAKYVACKRFHPQRSSSHNDPARELDNLQVLKESITSHDHIRLHLAIILHKGKHLILLPWADHLDLDIFLLEGRDFFGQEIYDFDRRFPRIQRGAMINDICTQMHHVADALEWLHKGVTPRGMHHNKICFAHMDLKPNNILIDNDNGPSTVGKWVLTDFGISAFKEDDGSNSSNLVSVRDYYQNLTINTPPRRDPGAYQPPEVEHTDNKSLERRITAKEGSAGRRGDIWSYGCIFSEVLAFSLGRATLVKEFRTVRKGRHKNDYFYEKVYHDDNTLKPDDTGAYYRVRPGIIEWLRTLPGRYIFPKSAIDCCVETILGILLVDGSRRPKADELLAKINHVARHVNGAKAPGGFPPDCPLSKPIPVFNSPPTPPSHGARSHLPPNSLPGVPSINRVNSIEKESLLGSQSFWGPSLPDRASGVMAGMPSDLQSSPKSREDSLVDPGTSSAGSATGLGIDDGQGKSPSVSDMTQSPVPNRPLSRESRRELHGVTINPNKNRRVLNAVEVKPPDMGKRKVLSISLCPWGERLAYLTVLKCVKMSRPKYELFLYDLLLGKCEIRRHGRVPADSPGQLLHGVELWDHVALASDNVVCWGKTTNGTKQVYFSDGKDQKTWNGSECTWLPSLIAIAVSVHGSLAFVTTRSIVYTTIEEILGGAHNIQETLRAKSDHSFTHAAFNDDGSLLYAWEYGRPDDCLSVWRVSSFNQKLILPADSEGSYQSKQQGSPAATLIPYNSYHGCIILAQNDVFFPAQIRSTQRGVSETLPKKTVTIPDVVAACVFGDHSLLVVRDGWRHTRIWEHHIVGGGTHVIEDKKPGEKPLAELSCVAGKGSRMRVVPVRGTDDLVIVLCLANGKVVILPLVAEPGQ